MRQLTASPARAILVLATAIGLLVGATAMADTVYKWKDANGQSHYSQQPPEGRKYETINSAGDAALRNDQLPAASAASDKQDSAAATGKPGAPTPAQRQREQLCKNARANAATLTQHAVVTGDINGDGKTVTLNAAQHDQALKDANKAIDLYCAH